MRGVLRSASLLFGLFCLLGGLGPLPFQVFHSGSAALLLYGAVLLALHFLWNRFDSWGKISRRLREVNDHRQPPPPLWWRRLRGFLAVCLTLAALGGGVTSIFMAKAAWGNPPPPGCTVVVLGCQAVNGRPSVMLQRRLDAALVYLRENPDSPVICTGGIDDNGELYSEAQVMSVYLQKNGIAPERIYREDASTNTLENIGNARTLFDQNQLPLTVAVATDGFHQLRGQLYAEHYGLTAYGLPCRTPWGLLPGYWVREWMGLAKAIVLDL